MYLSKLTHLIIQIFRYLKKEDYDQTGQKYYKIVKNYKYQLIMQYVWLIRVLFLAKIVC